MLYVRYKSSITDFFLLDIIDLILLLIKMYNGFRWLSKRLVELVIVLAALFITSFCSCAAPVIKAME